MAGTSTTPRAGWYDNIQGTVYTLLESPADSNRLRKIIIYFIATLIILNVAVVILETVNGLYLEFTTFFSLFDLFTVIVFSTEYILRVWCCVKNPLYASPLRGRVRFALSPYALIDLVALTPFYLPLIIPIEFRLLRMLRLLRIFRVLRLGRYSNAFSTLVDVMKSKKEEMVVATIMVVIILVIASSALYMVERDAQPEEFGSIPDAMWWAVVTLATVGYGDVYPITPLGKFLGALIALTAIGLFALPAGILASGFVGVFEGGGGENAKKPVTCPRCGTLIDPRTSRERDPPDNGNGNEMLKEVREKR
jgi:voltage-gated potassium channel